MIRSPTVTRHHHPNNKADGAAALLKPCTSLRHLKQIHAHILRSNLHRNASLASTLISLYSSLSSPHHSRRVFTSFPNPNLSLFNHAIRAFSKAPSLCSDAFALYRRMVRAGIRPDNYSYPFILNSCAARCDVCGGGEVHGRVVKTGFGFWLPVSNALIDMYGKCGGLGDARKVFDEMTYRDVVSYNAVLGAHARGGVGMEMAAAFFERMQGRNAISWNAMIVGYVNSGDVVAAREVFDRMPERDGVSWITMLVGYTKNGFMDKATGLFDEMREPSLICWTAMISGYSQSGRPSEALSVFRRMDKSGVKPDAFTMTAVMSALAQLGRADLADWIGLYVEREGIEQNEQVLTALVDMHAKCGNMEEACHVFEKIPRKDVFSYSAIITGLASHGHGNKALEIFQRMLAEKIIPDHITFVGVLTACGHAGLVEDGMIYWESMTRDYNIQPDADLYACVVDMLGRAGKLTEAHNVVKGMPMGPQPGALGALLAACRTYGNVVIAESVADKLFKLEPENTGNYMLLSSIYASKEQWDEARKVREAMNKKSRIKLPGFSWVEISKGHSTLLKNQI
ncbi:putative pentatricopeptide repeat-containing protein At5g37570 [Argentina anserina]|uniref:putative pentatricopeptide repeat-containing protein At5g37570 n=1 Tax=Argentina anserina TaxID=57926 RepID=UPI002176544E|nr:putative pentatricopeptide repeat-containing protein At5g37570 [Potentilla anserina]